MLSSACRFGVVHASGGKRKTAGGNAPVNTLQPLLSVENWLGNTGGLSSTSGTWTGDPTIAYTYRWYFNNTNLPIPNENQSVFQNIFNGPAESGYYAYMLVTAINAAGSVTARSSNICYCLFQE